MSLDEEMEKLQERYVEDVLPHLFKSITNDKLSNSQTSISNGSFGMSLGIESILKCAPEYKVKGNRFVHFTSIGVLQSIINTQVIRMYSLNNVNDPKEFELAAEKFGYTKPQMALLKERIYTFSMCHKNVLNSEHVLTLWRLYGANGNGCVIEFEIDQGINYSTHIKLANIVYANPDYSAFFKANKNFEEIHNRKVKIKPLIKLPACLHKSPLYRVENEIRLVCDGFAHYEKVFKPNSRYKYDINRSGNIVSFYEIPLNKQNMVMPEIRIRSIEFGFKVSKSKFLEYEKHIKRLYRSLNLNNDDRMDLPEIKMSPLKGIYN